MSDVMNVLYRIDLMKPNNDIQFTLEDFNKRPQEIGVFINTLTDLNKMISYDQRDPYEDRAFKNDHPEWTDWDRFVKP
jgi:serine/threonine-protein phosphatase 2A regulatory subunit B''